MLQVVLAVWVVISLNATVQRRPLRVLLEQAHGLGILYHTLSALSLINTTASPSTHILLIRREPMINARRHNHQITLFQPNPHPIITLASDIKVPSTFQNIPDLFILMQMLMEEVLHLLFVVGEGRG